MDMAFLLRAQRMLGEPAAEPARLDHAMFRAALAAQQAASATARAQAEALERGAEPRPGAGPDEPLTEILLGTSGWRRALDAQGGCFHRAGAGGAYTSRQPDSPGNLPSYFSLPSTLSGYTDCDGAGPTDPAAGDF